MPRPPLFPLAAIVLAACTSSTASPPSSTLDVAAWVDDFSRDARGARTRLAAVPDPAERDLLILGVLSAMPGQARALCDLAGSAETTDHCDKLSRRPHLHDRQSGPPRRHGGPAAPGGAPLLPKLAARWSALAPDPGDCAGRSDLSRCLFDAAGERAAAGDTDGAGTRCRAQPVEASRHECFFRSSEQATAADQPFDGTIQLCAGAGSFQRQCLSHAHAALADKLRGLAPDEAAGQASHQLIALRRYWIQTAPSVLDEAEQQYLFSAAGSFVTAAGVSSAALSALPAAIVPHIRTHVAERVASNAAPFEDAATLMSGAPVSLPPRGSSAFKCAVGVDRSDPRPKTTLGSGTRYRLSDPGPERDLELAVGQAVADLQTPNLGALGRATLLRPAELAWLEQQGRRRHDE